MSEYLPSSNGIHLCLHFMCQARAWPANTEMLDAFFPGFPSFIQRGESILNWKAKRRAVGRSTLTLYDVCRQGEISMFKPAYVTLNHEVAI